MLMKEVQLLYQVVQNQGSSHFSPCIFTATG